MAVSVIGYPAPSGPCDVCGAADSGGVAVVVGLRRGFVCVWCLAPALERATGWQIEGAWRQWDAVASAARERRGSRPPRPRRSA